jgi:hypothetical protein
MDVSPREQFLAIAARRAELPAAEDAFGWRILAEYGAVFVTTATPPPKVVFDNPEEVDEFQKEVGQAEAPFDGVPVALQRPALDALLRATEEAASLGLRVAPRGPDAAARSWGDSEALWRGRVERACDHWCGLGRLGDEQARGLRALDTRAQAAAVLDLEREGVWFSTFFDKSILHSVAAPGTSQHLSMLAFDVADFADERVRRLLTRHGWHQTVVSDLPHFTFLGREEAELPGLGLRREALQAGGQVYDFWVPAL